MNNLNIKRAKFLCIICFMILLDQCIKLIIHNNHMNKSFNIIFDIVRFRPMTNTKFSWFNSLFDLGISRTIHILIVLIALCLVLMMYCFIEKMYTKNKLTDFLFMCIISAAICSLIDKVFWGGSLDYIQLKGLFTFDLKDVYATLFEILIIGIVVFNYKNFRNIDEKKIYKDFKKYISQLIKRNKT